MDRALRLKRRLVKSPQRTKEGNARQLDASKPFVSRRKLVFWHLWPKESLPALLAAAAPFTSGQQSGSCSFCYPLFACEVKNKAIQSCRWSWPTVTQYRLHFSGSSTRGNWVLPQRYIYVRVHRVSQNYGASWSMQMPGDRRNGKMPYRFAIWSFNFVISEIQVYKCFHRNSEFRKCGGRNFGTGASEYLFARLMTHWE